MIKVLVATVTLTEQEIRLLLDEPVKDHLTKGMIEALTTALERLVPGNAIAYS